LISLELPEDPATDLDALCQAKQAEYRGAAPFPHIHLDGVFSDALLERVLEEFPAGDKKWRMTERESKSKSKAIVGPRQELGPYTTYLMAFLGSPRFLRFVEALTGIEGLVSDPYLNGGGLHEIKSGGYLELHSDFNWNGHLRMYRRLNLLLYLNKDWKEEYNGALELWDRRLEKSAKYYPLWNRMIIQHVTSGAMHGFPAAIACPEDVTRKSIAVWYYTAELPVDVQLGYDLCEPDFIQRGERPAPLPRPLYRRLIPPVFRALVPKKRQTKTFSSEEFWSVVTRFVPPLAIEAYARLRGRDTG
jgi:hypothetical protein